MDEQDINLINATEDQLAHARAHGILIIGSGADGIIESKMVKSSIILALVQSLELKEYELPDDCIIMMAPDKTEKIIAAGPSHLPNELLKELSDTKYIESYKLPPEKFQKNWEQQVAPSARISKKDRWRRR